MFWFCCVVLFFHAQLFAGIIEEWIETGAVEGKKIGIYCGTFDPIHRGHEGFARWALEKKFCDYVLLIPHTSGTVYKQPSPLHHRRAMLWNMCVEDPHLLISRLDPLELSNMLRPYRHQVVWIGLVGSSKALQLVEEQKNPERETLRIARLEKFMTGALTTSQEKAYIREAETIFAVSSFLLAQKNMSQGQRLPRQIGNRPVLGVYDNPLQNISSSFLRKHARDAEKVAPYLHPKVHEYIQTHSLY